MGLTGSRALPVSAAVLSLVAVSASGRGAEGSGELSIVSLSGSPRERGLQHGRALRAKIRAGVSRWKRALSEAHAEDSSRVITGFLKRTDHLAAIRRWTPELIEEVRGIAEGSGLDLASVLAFQLASEIRASDATGTSAHGNALGIAGGHGHPAFVAQNADLEGFRDGFQAVLRIRDESGHEALVFTQAGLIALNGLNDRRVGVVAATLAERPGSPEGLPAAFVVRGLLQRNSLADALSFAKEVAHASARSYILGGSERVVQLEASAGTVIERGPTGDGRVIFHSSHPLALSRESPARRRVLLAGGGGPAPGQSEVGLATLAARLSRYAGTPPLSLIEDTLRSQDSPEHPICRPHRGDDTFFSFGSTIMQLSEAPELRVAPGPPNSHEYRALRFD